MPGSAYKYHFAIQDGYAFVKLRHTLVVRLLKAEMVYLDHQKKCEWESRSQYIMALLCQTIGITTFILLPLAAISHGAAGNMIGYMLAYVLFGIPLLYMEFIVSQFTARDCLQVWKIRSCLSHIGYIQVFWQIVIMIYNHTIISFTIHYFLISFENPVPYHVCGRWATKDCGILEYNYTVNQDCIKFRDEANSYCDNLFKTFPECQYWRHFILGLRNNYYYVAWRVCLASAIACSLTFLSCFKRKKSLRWVLSFLTVFPIVGYIILFIGSMMQKGVTTSYENAIDADFSVFVRNYRISNIIQQVLYNLNIGTGVSFNLGASTSFRAPCYSNIVITVAVCAVFTTFAICTIAMMACPFSYEKSITPSIFSNYAMALIFEKLPTLLKAYNYSYFWLILSFSCNAILGLSTNIIICHHILELLAERSAIVHKYSGLTCFACVVVLFFVTTPLLGNAGVYDVFSFRKMVQLVTIFLTIVECLVFVVWYGLEKFSEDVHFMQGIQPKSCMKMAWLMSSFVVAYVFFNELYIIYFDRTENFGAMLGWCTLLVLLGFMISITLFKFLVAAFRKQFLEQIRVDPLWGPKNEILMRSRAMFTAQAMTKEYIYRQYHLQAGILGRQRTSNVRRAYNE